ncbi:hypothetical protein HYZ76_00450 [Candidatus Falkowbacteria bacterium]|nr:hypothetical protein [Candidatus Falkowbacteria bacterium]
MKRFNFWPKTKRKTKLYQTTLRLRIGFLAIFILFSLVISPIAQARIFNPHNIITDRELTDYSSLSQAAIQKFLERKNSVLARYSQMADGKPMKVSEIVWTIAQTHKINPKFLLTTLEKEQGLISRSQATEKALDWATGYSCYGGGCNEKYKGLYNQLEATAETQEIYIQKASQFSFRVGQPSKSFDGLEVIPANQATANLYIYTPYVGYSPEIGVTAPYGGNRLFWRIWHRYFSSQKFLDGQVVSHNGNYYLIQNNRKRKFMSRELFLKDYRESDAINVSSTDLAAYPDGPVVEFSANTLVRSDASGQIYLISENQKRPIIDNSALALLDDFRIAVTASEVPTVSESKLTPYSLGTLISSASVFPQGKLFKGPARSGFATGDAGGPDGVIWQIKDGLKHKVDQAVWQNRFEGEEAEPISADALEAYPTGSPLGLKDGTFVINGGNYYLISSGERVKIEDAGIFDRVFGLSKKNSALSVSSELLEVHKAGENIDYIDDTIQDLPQASAPNAAAGSYSAEFSSLEPEGLIMVSGQTQSITIKFKNNGGSIWQNGDVWLEIKDKEADTSSFGAAEKINFTENSVASSQIASFTFDLTAPSGKSGLLTQEFGLYYNKNGTPTKITSIGKFVIVKTGVAAQILEHDIPAAIRNTWRPVEIKMKIQNTSSDIEWLSNKTVLELYNADGSESPFYDPNDWIRKEAVGVPLNKPRIAPGETGEFIFTLDPRNIKAGIYVLNFQLKLLDKDKEVFLNGGTEWRREIRVD